MYQEQQTQQTPRLSLPNLKPSIHVTIAGFLAGANAYGSLATYSSISRAVRDATLPVLYETVILDRDELEVISDGVGDKGLTGWRHTR
jgi:hypothetical protein